MAAEAARKRRKVASARIARADSPRRSSAAELRVPSGRATRATTPKTAEVSASPRKSQKKERSARNPAAAGPKANPALMARRYKAKAVTRCGGGTRSASSAPLAGRYISAVNPASPVSSMIRARWRACERSSRGAAARGGRQAAQSVGAHHGPRGGRRISLPDEIQDEKRDDETAEPVDEGAGKEGPGGGGQAAHRLPQARGRGQLPRPAHRSLVGLGFDLIVERRQLYLAVAAAQRQHDQVVGEPGILRQQRPMEVRAVRVSVCRAFGAVLAVVAEPRHHLPQRVGRGTQDGPPAVILKSDEGGRGAGLRWIPADDDVADQARAALPWVLRRQVEEPDPRQIPALRRPVVMAHQLIAAADRQQRCSCLDGLAQRRAFALLQVARRQS